MARVSRRAFAHLVELSTFAAKMLQMAKTMDSAPPTGGKWPEPRVLALEVEDIYRHAPTATAFSI